MPWFSYRNPNIICSSFDRPNLFLSVSVKASDIFADLRKFMVRAENGRNYKFDGPTIIYCQTKRATEAILFILRGTVPQLVMYIIYLDESVE